jgi:hypothetical protein
VSDNVTEGIPESERFVEIPLERAQAFGRLISEARGWRGSLIPSTSTGLWGPTRNLLEAITAFDRAPCDHPRSWRVYRVVAADAEEVCGYCGMTVVPGLIERSDPDPISSGPVVSDPTSSSPPESSSPAP